MKDLMSAEFVFLQHGVIKDDLAWWLKRWNKNISLFCCSAQRERESIVSNKKYGYDEQVKLTGLARHDKLLRGDSIEARTLIIAPTWRRNLVGPLVDGSSKHEADEGFKKSDYYRFFEKLLNDKEIARAIESNNMEAHFLLHPSFSEARKMFSSSYCSIPEEYDYTKEFLSGSILLTDYSSVFFDFSILEKPVLYAQFDREVFFETHMEKGYFDYDKDGFGPVCLTYEETKKELLKMIENPEMDKKYLDRVRSFFGPLRPDACERIVSEIEKLG